MPVMPPIVQSAILDTRRYMAGVRQIQTANATMGAGLMQSSRSMAAFGASMTSKVSLPIAIAAGAITATAVSFQAAMYKMRSLVGIGEKQMVSFGKSIEKLAPATGRGPKELAESLYFITSSGFKTAEAMDILKVSAKAAAAGLGPTQTTADAVTSAMMAYADSGLTAKQATDTLIAAVREGKAEPEQLARSIGRVIAPAKIMGITFDQVTGAVAAMTLQGLNAYESVTALRGIIRTLQDPSAQAAKKLAAFGFNMQQVRDNIRQKGILAALVEFRAELDKQGIVYTDIFENIRAFNGFTLITQGNLKKTAQVFDETSNAISGATNETERAFKVVQDTSKMKLERSLAALQVTAIKFAPPLLKALDSLSAGIKSIAVSFSKLSEGTQSNIVKFGFIAAAIGPVVLILGKLATAFLFAGRGMRVFGAMSLRSMPFGRNANWVQNQVGSTLGRVPVSSEAVQTRMVQRGMQDASLYQTGPRVARSRVFNMLPQRVQDRANAILPTPRIDRNAIRQRFAGETFSQRETRLNGQLTRQLTRQEIGPKGQFGKAIPPGPSILDREVAKVQRRQAVMGNLRSGMARAGTGAMVLAMALPLVSAGLKGIGVESKAATYGISGALAGGAAFGPWGAAAGAAIGIVVSLMGERLPSAAEKFENRLKEQAKIFKLLAREIKNVQAALNTRNQPTDAAMRQTLMGKGEIGEYRGILASEGVSYRDVNKFIQSGGDLKNNTQVQNLLGMSNASARALGNLFTKDDMVKITQARQRNIEKMILTSNAPAAAKAFSGSGEMLTGMVEKRDALTRATAKIDPIGVFRGDTALVKQMEILTSTKFAQVMIKASEIGRTFGEGAKQDFLTKKQGGFGLPGQIGASVLDQMQLSGLDVKDLNGQLTELGTYALKQIQLQLIDIQRMGIVKPEVMATGRAASVFKRMAKDQQALFGRIETQFNEVQSNLGGGLSPNPAEAVVNTLQSMAWNVESNMAALAKYGKFNPEQQAKIRTQVENFRVELLDQVGSLASADLEELNAFIKMAFPDYTGTTGQDVLDRFLSPEAINSAGVNTKPDFYKATTVGQAEAFTNFRTALAASMEANPKQYAPDLTALAINNIMGPGGQALNPDTGATDLLALFRKTIDQSGKGTPEQQKLNENTMNTIFKLAEAFGGFPALSAASTAEDGKGKGLIDPRVMTTMANAFLQSTFGVGKGDKNARYTKKQIGGMVDRMNAGTATIDGGVTFKGENDQDVTMSKTEFENVKFALFDYEEMTRDLTPKEQRRADRVARREAKKTKLAGTGYAVPEPGVRPTGTGALVNASAFMGGRVEGSGEVYQPTAEEQANWDIYQRGGYRGTAAVGFNIDPAKPGGFAPRERVGMMDKRFGDLGTAGLKGEGAPMTAERIKKQQKQLVKFFKEQEIGKKGKKKWRGWLQDWQQGAVQTEALNTAEYGAILAGGSFRGLDGSLIGIDAQGKEYNATERGAQIGAEFGGQVGKAGVKGGKADGKASVAQPDINADKATQGAKDVKTAKDSVKDSIEAIQKLPKPDIKIKVDSPGVGDAADKINRLGAAMAGTGAIFKGLGVPFPAGMVKTIVDTSTGGAVAYMGGLVRGNTNQPVPMTLHGGEYVLPANVVSAIRHGQMSRNLSLAEPQLSNPQVAAPGRISTTVAPASIDKSIKLEQTNHITAIDPRKVARDVAYETQWQLSGK